MINQLYFDYFLFALLALFFFLSNLLIGNQINPKTAAKIATIIPIVAAITPPPTPGPKYARLGVVIKKKQASFKN